MRRRILSHRALLLPLALLLSAPGYRPTRHPLQVAGTISLVAKPNDHPQKGPDGAPVVIGESKGRNESTGKPDFMDGADVTSADTASLVNGTGSHHGYLTMSKGGDKVTFKWGGQVTTTVGEDKKPSSTFQGTWTAVGGAGKYDGVSGSGSYQGRFTSSTASTTEWKGELGK
jgi:hypothetical protein